MGKRKKKIAKDLRREADAIRRELEAKGKKAAQQRKAEESGDVTELQTNLEKDERTASWNRRKRSR